MQGEQIPLNYFFYLRIGFWLLSGRGADEKKKRNIF
jgi:hypothetical protein